MAVTLYLSFLSSFTNRPPMPIIIMTAEPLKANGLDGGANKVIINGQRLIHGNDQSSQQAQQQAIQRLMSSVDQISGVGYMNA